MRLIFLYCTIVHIVKVNLQLCVNDEMKIYILNYCIRISFHPIV